MAPNPDARERLMTTLALMEKKVEELVVGLRIRREEDRSLQAARVATRLRAAVQRVSDSTEENSPQDDDGLRLTVEQTVQDLDRRINDIRRRRQIAVNTASCLSVIDEVSALTRESVD